MTVRVGLVGYGLSGRVFHAPLFEAAGVDLHCVASSNAEKVHADYPGIIVHPNYDALLADENVDLVVLATPSDLHAEQLLKALAAGKHVIAEKPFTSTVAEADTVIAAARSANRIVTCFQNRRWDSDFLTIRQLIDNENRVLQSVFTMTLARIWSIRRLRCLARPTGCRVIYLGSAPVRRSQIRATFEWVTRKTICV